MLLQLLLLPGPLWLAAVLAFQLFTLGLREELPREVPWLLWATSAFLLPSS